MAFHLAQRIPCTSAKSACVCGEQGRIITKNNDLGKQMNRYLVGGAVRDQLLGIHSQDKDWVVVGATPQQMLDAGFTPVGQDFPVFLHPKTKEEYALARTERKSGKGYTGFTFDTSPHVTLEEDLIRRDLTINAIAQDAQGNLHDPYNGHQDLQDKLLRHVSEAFSEDPLRVLRVARFYARYHHLGFTVHIDTKNLINQLANSGELDYLTPERIWKETSRALQEATPTAYFELLHETGALAILFPELDALWGVEQPKQHHPEIDTGIHTMMVLNYARTQTDDVDILFACVCHDLGKGITPADILPHHYGHEAQSKRLTQLACERWRIPNKTKILSLLVAEFHTHCHKAFELKASSVLKLFNNLDVWRQPERFEKFLQCCLADSRGRTNFEERDYPQIEYLRACHEAAEQVSVADVIAKGYQGAQIRTQLDNLKKNAIAVVKASFKVP